MALLSKAETGILLDSGAIGRDFITRACITRLRLNSQRLLYPIKIISIHGEENATEGIHVQHLSIKSLGQEIKIPSIKLIVLKQGPADIIIGLETLRNNNVFGLLSRYFGTGGDVKSGLINPTGAQGGGEVGCASLPRTSRNPGRTPINSLIPETVPVGRKMVHISQLIPISEIDDETYALQPDEMYGVSDDQQTHKYDVSPDPDIPHAGAGSVDIWEFKVHGSMLEKQQLLTILNKYRDIFSPKLRGTPASVTPMKIEVDYDKYKADRRSREPTRAQSSARKMAIAQWIRQAIADGVIKPSVAPAWAQLMLTKKPNGTWRFAVDYRALNLHTKAMRAPIPNIKKLLHQIGGKRPGIFAKMDFTSGFYQTPVETGDMKYTAFDTH
jgi:hypothetical protein